MAAKTSTATLRANAGNPSIEVLIGQRQLGFYQVQLRRSGQTSLEKIGAGDNEDNINDIYDLGPVDGLNSGILICDVAIIRLLSRPGELYDISLILRQNNRMVSGALISDNGRLNSDRGLCSNGAKTWDVSLEAL